MIHRGCSHAERRRQGFPLAVLMAFTLIQTGCHRAVPRSENVPVRENVPVKENAPVREKVPVNTEVSRFFQDTAPATPGQPPGSRTFNLRSPGQRDSLRAVIKQQRGMWAAGGVRDYHFLLRESCFCPGQLGWILLEVHSGQTVRGWDKRGKPVPLTADNNYSIDGLFDLLEQDADHHDVVAVDFEDRWHYPAFISTDARVGRPDDWGLVEVRGFRPR